MEGWICFLLDIPLWSGILVYYMSSIGGVLLVKLLNYRYCFTSWWVLALLSRSTWIFSLVLHQVLQYREQIYLPTVSRRQLRIYLCIALGLSVVELFNSLSMSMLPGNLYMLIKGSDVGWSMALSSAILQKRYGRCQIIAAAFIMGGIAVVFVWDFGGERSGSGSTTTVGSRESDHLTKSTYYAMLCLLGASLNALCSVGTEATLKKTLQEEQDRLFQEQHQQDKTSSTPSPPKLLLSNAYSLWTSLFSFLLLAIPASLSRRGRGDNDYDRHNVSIPFLASFTCDGNDNSTNTTITSSTANPYDQGSTSVYQHTTATTILATTSMIVILGSFAGLTLSRFLERLAKYFICVYDSAVTFSIVQAARRWSGIYIVGFLFSEGFSTAMMIGSVVSGIGFVLHATATATANSQSIHDVTTSRRSGSGHQNHKAARHQHHDRRGVHGYKKLASNISDDISDLELTAITESEK